MNDHAIRYLMRSSDVVMKPLAEKIGFSALKHRCLDYYITLHYAQNYTTKKRTRFNLL